MLKRLINGCLGQLQLRLVNARWGPVGFRHSLGKLARTGWQPSQVIDVGAWQGTWTLECMRLFPHARYLLIDPLPENRQPLEAVAARHANVRPWHGAAGPADADLALHRHADQSSPLVATVPQWRGTETILVPQRTLDSFLAAGEILPPQLLKADVQGYELEVLRGAERVLRSLDAVLLEVSFRHLYEGQPLAHEIVGHMAGRGFRIFDVCSYSQDESGDLVQSDLLFVRGDWPTPRPHPPHHPAATTHG